MVDISTNANDSLRNDSCGTCSRCHERPTRAANQRWCRECTTEAMRENRPTWSELPAYERKRSNCRRMTKYYVKQGRIHVTPCRVCAESKGELRLDGGESPEVVPFHPDFENPRNVVWLCKPHRKEWQDRARQDDSSPAVFDHTPTHQESRVAA